MHEIYFLKNIDQLTKIKGPIIYLFLNYQNSLTFSSKKYKDMKLHLLKNSHTLKGTN